MPLWKQKNTGKKALLLKYGSPDGLAHFQKARQSFHFPVASAYDFCIFKIYLKITIQQPLNVSFDKSGESMNMKTSCFQHIGKTPPVKKKSCTIIFCWTAFCFDYGAHLLWRCFDNLMQRHNIYFHPELHSFLAKILY